MTNIDLVIEEELSKLLLCFEETIDNAGESRRC